MAVNGGHVDIVGRGFNASNVDYVAIWARSMALHAQYYAKDTAIVLGNNTIDVPNGLVNSGDPSIETPERVCIGCQRTWEHVCQCH